MKNLLKAAAVLVAFFTTAFSSFGQEAYSPSGTYLFGTKDGQDLYLDDYAPAKGSETTFQGHAKPTIVFMFGGGFMEGTRDDKGYRKWFKMMNDEGYRVISIDYRLGMKDVKTKGGLGSVKAFHHAVEISSEDLFSATAFLIANAQTFGVDPKNIVTCGSSAGAMTVLEADWLLCNGKAAGILPDDFHYAGVMSFSGAILSNEGMPSYKTTPAPTALFHGTSDKVVNYNKIRVFNWAFAGSSKLAKIFKKEGYCYNILRYTDHTHEIAGSMAEAFPEVKRFLETNVMLGVRRNIDSTIDDPSMPRPHGSANRKELYAN